MQPKQIYQESTLQIVTYLGFYVFHYTSFYKVKQASLSFIYLFQTNLTVEKHLSIEAVAENKWTSFIALVKELDIALEDENDATDPCHLIKLI